jgi:hydrogenase small subunit
MANVLWLQGGACSGNTMSFLNAEEPTVVELVTDFGINILWHPSMGLEIGHQVIRIMQDCISGKVKLDILVYEGTIVKGPNGSGTMNYFCERPMKDWMRELSNVASYVVAIGDCASWGGIPAVPRIQVKAQDFNFTRKIKVDTSVVIFVQKADSL